MEKKAYEDADVKYITLSAASRYRTRNRGICRAPTVVTVPRDKSRETVSPVLLS